MNADALRGALAGLSVACFLLASPPVPAQVATPLRSTLRFEYPPALPQRDGPAPPRLNLSLAGEIPIPGPLGRVVLELSDGRLLLQNGGEAIAASPELGSAVETLPPASHDSDRARAWVYSDDGRYRFRTLAEGKVEAEKKSRYKKSGWARKWTLDLPAATPSPPIIVGKRLCWAGLDDQVVCVRADNGHRMWAIDVGERVSRPLSVWTATLPFAQRKGKPESLRTVWVLLVVPDPGRSLLVLDAYDGNKVASLELPPERGRFASAAVVVSDTRIAVARQGYVPDEAALSLIDLSLPEARPGPDAAPIPYNGAPSSTDPRPGGE